MWFQVFVFCWLVASAQASVLFATTKAWNQVVRATMKTDATYVQTEVALSESELQQRFEEVWDGLLQLCPSLPEDGKQYIDLEFDDALLSAANPPLSRVLGWASRTELLSSGVWSGALATDEGVRLATNMGLTNLGTLRVARQPPGGWFRGGESVCNDRFRLEDVLLHELLHLLGVSSSVRKLADGSLAVGSEYMGTCFPGAFDRKIADEDGNMVVGKKCEFSGSLNQPLFVNGVRLFAETDGGDFVQGTSLSHVMSRNAVLSPSVSACDPSGTRPLTSEDAMTLMALNVQCDALRLPHATILNSQQTLEGGQSTDQTPRLGSFSPSQARCRVQSCLALTAAAAATLFLALR